MSGTRIRVKNPDLDREEFTSVGADYTAGTTGTALTVSSNDDIAANDKLVIGNSGEEQTELATVSSIPAGNTGITLTANLKFSHPTGTPIFKTLYDQISVERKPSAGAYAEITEGKINIDIDAKDGFTIVSIAAGLTTDTYKWRFFNSTTGTYSAYSDELLGTGLPYNSVGYMVEQVRKDASIPDHQAVTDETIIDYLNAGQYIIQSMPINWWFLLTTDTPKVTVSGQYNYALASNFLRMEALIYNDTTANYRLRKVSLEEFDSLRMNSSSDPNDDTIRSWAELPSDGTATKGYFGVHPTPATAGRQFTQRYIQEMPTLDSFGDTTLVPIPQVLIDYGIYRVHSAQGHFGGAGYPNLATEYKNRFAEGISMLKTMQKREIKQSTVIKRFLGHRGKSKLYSNKFSQYSDTIRENYW